MKPKEIVNFRQEGMVKGNPTENGTYMTIRVGLSGIYTMINVWENDKWQIEVLDASSTIARSEKPLTAQEIDNLETLNEKKMKYKIGDVVRVISRDAYEQNKSLMSPTHSLACGKVFKIKDIVKSPLDNKERYIFDDDYIWTKDVYWKDCMIEGLAEEEIN